MATRIRGGAAAAKHAGKTGHHPMNYACPMRALCLALVTLAATPATAVDNFAWRCGETLVIASISQKTINVAISGPKKANDVETITSDPQGSSPTAAPAGSRCGHQRSLAPILGW
jgi:hypothetical protein